MVSLRPATPADHPSIRRVHIDAFSGTDEADIIEQLREDGDALVEIVAENEDGIAGHVMFSRMLSQNGTRFAALGPLAVSTAHQSEGIGGELSRAGIEQCRALGMGALCVLGHPTYYPRFGFSAEAAKRFDAPYARPAFMAMELIPGTLDRGGIVRYAPAFGSG